MNNKLLIVLDMDGTLLDDKKKIHLYSKRILKKLQDEGNIVVLASGRAPFALLKYYNEIGLNSPIICYNGSYIFSPIDKSFPTYKFEFDREIIKKIYKNLGKKIIKNMICEDVDKIWANVFTQGHKDFLWIDHDHSILGDIDKTLNENPMTVIFEYNNLSDKEIIKSEIEKYDGMGCRFWRNTQYCELYYKNNTKGNSLERLIKYLDIKYENIIVFGDEHNDIDMFKHGKYSVAMKNGRDELKKYAYMISSKDNNHNGVYFSLKKILKLINYWTSSSFNNAL